MLSAIAEKRFSDVLVEIIGQQDETISTVAARFRWPEGTTRNYRDGESSPTFDRLAALARLPVRETTGVRDHELMAIAQSLVGGRLKVSLVPPSELPANVKPETVIARAVEAGHAWQLLLEDVTSRAVDGQISGEDATSITLVAADCEVAIQRVVLCAMKCSGQSRS